MSDNPNHYEVLGVQHDATLEQIIHAYNAYKGKGIDENPQDSPQISKEKLQAVKVAYDILKDRAKRAEYDGTLAGVPTVHNNQAVLGLGQTSLSLENIPIEKEEHSEKGKAVSVEKVVVDGTSSPVSDVDDKVETPVAPHGAPPQSEIQPVAADDNADVLVAHHNVVRKMELHHDVSGKAAKEESGQWADAIENSDHLKLMELLEKDKSCLWKYEKEGRTAFTIAAEVNDGELAELILEELLKAQRENESYFFFQLLNSASDFDSFTDYIEKSKPLKPSSVLSQLIEQKEEISKEEGYSRAIEQRDWATLLNMLDTRGFLRIFVNYQRIRGQRLTLLHVAAMHGCFVLVKELLNKLTSELETRNFAEDEVLAFIGAVDPETQLTALQMADDIIGNRSISELIKHTQRFIESPNDTMSDFVANRSEGLFEAYPHTQWYKELKMYVEQGHERFSWPDVDSAMLRHSLKQNSRLLLEAFHGLSALHLAILFGDMRLELAIKALFGREQKIEWGHSYYPEALSWEQMYEAKGVHGVEFDWVNFQYTELNLLPYYNISVRKIAEITTNKYLSFIDFKGEIITTSLPEHSPTFSAMNEYITQEWNVNHEEWQKGFEADVDFNFEAEPRKSLLRVHHACKDPLQFQGFLEYVSKHENFNEFSTRMHDAKGRTLHHILLDHYTTDKDPGWAFIEIFPFEVCKFCIKHAQDSRGRRLMDILIGKNYLQRNVTLNPYSYFNMKFEHDGPRKDHSLFFGNYYIAKVLQQTIIASQPIWVEVLQTHLAKLKTLKLLPFVIATSADQTMLQALSRIEPQVDLMVQDKKKRTLLHYAADPTSFKFETLLDMASNFERSIIYDCFSTVQDYCEFRKKLFSKNDTGIDSNDHSSWTDDEKDEIIQSNVRRRACILMLLQAGLDLSQQDNDRKVPSIGPTSDATYQTWWYDMVVKDATDNKNSFNQAGNALSVVGTLVAATSYIGPLQPPMSYTEPGLVRYSKKLVEVFMVTNTLAFFLAMASVMFAVVPSLPMPRESVISELKRARQMVLVSLCLLLVAIAAIIISFSAASVVVSQYEHSFPRSNILLGPLLMGWLICFIAATSFFIRILRLSFYENAVVQNIYQFSLRKFYTRTYLSFLVQDYIYFRSTIWRILHPLVVHCLVNFQDHTSFLAKFMIKVLQIVHALVLVIFSSLLFPIYFVFHIAVIIPCRKLIVHCARFRRRRHERGWEEFRG